MSALNKDREIEVKLHIHNEVPIIKALIEQDAILIQPRSHEYNLRFDNSTQELQRNKQVLRLRRDTNSRLTFKGPASIFHGVSSRPEFEFSVSDFEAAQKFVEALGYQVVTIYEKHRTIYELDSVKIMIDEMPYGKFIEIEGPDSDTIRACAESLNLNWDMALSEGYLELFDRVKHTHIECLSFRDLTFANFKDIKIDLQSLGVQIADTD